MFEQDQNITPEISVKNKSKDVSMPNSILIGAILISISIFSSAYLISKGELTGGALDQTGNKTGDVAKITDRPDQPFIGSQSAPITMYEFGDFQCPFCQNFFKNTLPELKTKYIDTGKIKLVFKHFPLSIHINAQISAEAAECANRQGGFEAYHDILYAKGQGDGTGLDTASLKKYAGQIGLNINNFNKCLDNHETKTIVAGDESVGISVSVDGTPTFFIEGKSIKGAQPLSVFEQVIDSVLK